MTKKREATRALLFAASIALLTTVASGQNGAFDPGKQPPISYHTKEVDIKVIARGHSRILAVTPSNGRELSVALPATFFQVDDLRAGANGKVLVIGRSGAYVSTVALVTLQPLLVEDSFTCFSPSVSPDGQFIVFVKFYPPHSSPAPDAHTMLYLTARSASENRPKGISPDNGVDVGFPLYPPEVGNWKADNMNVPEEEEHSLAGEYFWDSPSDFVFGDTKKSAFTIVRVNISGTQAIIRAANPNTLHGADFRGRLLNVTADGNDLKVKVSGTTEKVLYIRSNDFAEINRVSLEGRPLGQR